MIGAMNTRREISGWRVFWRRDTLSWSLYDFANTIFSMNIVSSYMKPWIVDDLGRDGFSFDLAVSLSMLGVAIISPALGVMSDHGSKKKLFLFLFTISCVTALAGLSFAPSSAFVLIIVLFAVANFFYEGGMVFYNALLYSVAKDNKEARFISGAGVALGYIGAILGLFLVLPFVSGELFGFSVPFIEASGKSGAFLPTAIMFLLFAIPVFLFVREKPGGTKKRLSFGQAYKSLFETLRNTKSYPGLARFIGADFLIKNAVNAVIINIGVFCLFVIGLDDLERTYFLSIVTIAAVVGSFVIGKLAVRMSLRKLIIVVAWGWIVSMALFGVAFERWMFWALSAMAGVWLGGVWTLHRPFLAELVSGRELGKFFGLYSLTGKSAAVLGPLWWALFFALFQPDAILGSWLVGLGDSMGFALSESALVQMPYRAAAASLSILVFAGLMLFKGIPEKENGIDLT
ncbi:MAG: MFS transporter [candidate division Zixibacteria bacterium]|nr:MFS transporter [candidate division Zixibacteria bacterium]